jgi:hypothetical protein
MTLRRTGAAALLIVAAVAAAPAAMAAPSADGLFTDPIGTAADAQRGSQNELQVVDGRPTTTTSTTTVPTTAAAQDGLAAGEPTGPGGTGRIADDILIGIALEIRNFAPPAWTASEESAIRARLEATNLSGSVSRGLDIRDDRSPVTDVAGTFTRPGPSIRNQFAPAAILGAILAWALITGLETRRRKGDATYP